MAEFAKNKSELSDARPSERWLLTRKTWRYMSRAAAELKRPPDATAAPADLASLQQHFQQVCDLQQRFLLCRTEHSSEPLESCGCPEDSTAAATVDADADPDTDYLSGERFDFGGQGGITSVEQGMEPQTAAADAPEACRGVATQTEDFDFFDLQVRRSDSPSDAAAVEVKSELPVVAVAAVAAAASATSAAPTHTFSNAVMKYFGMGRKKTDKDKIDRFKTVNYDRNLRTIPAAQRTAAAAATTTITTTNTTAPSGDAGCGSSVAIQVGETQLDFSSAKKKVARPCDWPKWQQQQRPVKERMSADQTTWNAAELMNSVVNCKAVGVCSIVMAGIRSWASSPEAAAAVTEDSGRWTTSPRYSVATSDDLVGWKDGASSVADDAELMNLVYTESEADFDLDSEFHYSQRNSIDSQVFFGDHFKTFDATRGVATVDCTASVSHTAPSLPADGPSLTSHGVAQVWDRSSRSVASCCSSSSSRTGHRHKASSSSPSSAYLLVAGSHHHQNVTAGFHLNSLLSAVMHKSKSGGSLAVSASSSSPASSSSCTQDKESGPAPTTTSYAAGIGGHASRIMAKKIWKTRSKSQSRASASSTCIWTPQGSCKWTSITGRQVALTDTTLFHLTEVERLTLQKVALAKLQTLNLGVAVRPPSEPASSGHKPKRRAHLLRKKALSGGTFFDGSKKDPSTKDRPAGGGLVFAIPLDQCIANDRTSARLRAGAPAPTGAATVCNEAGEDLTGSHMMRKSSHGSRASFGSLIEGFKPDKGGSCESLNVERKRCTSLSFPSTDVLTDDKTCSRVPAIVVACLDYLETHGLNTLGIFRVSSSKKRVRQLREDFDDGKDVELNEDCCPHDVATLLKEFFRDLPDPLLTRDLYSGFVQTQRVRNRRLQMEALQHLIQLLPVSNRDTLNRLLIFLANVAKQSSDHHSPTGELIAGNKMDSNNLATLFAPNILHMVKSGSSNDKIPPESVARAEERIDVINVIRSMIDHHKEIFELSAELLDEVYIHMMDTHPEAVDRLLRRRCQNDELREDLDTSSSVFEGSECSSVPRTPTYDDSHQSFSCDASLINNSPVGRSNNNYEIVTTTGASDQDATSHRKYRKREDILHENGGTGGRYAIVSRERRKEERHRVTEAMRSQTDPLLVAPTSSVPRRHNTATIKRADSADLQQSRITVSDSQLKQTVTVTRPVLNRERSEPTIERRIVVQPIVHSSSGVNLLQQLKSSSSDHSLADLERTVRRLSSPLITPSTPGVITASLRISVANAPTGTPTPTISAPGNGSAKLQAALQQTAKSFTVDDEHDIPFIEDNSSSQDDSSLNAKYSAKNAPPSSNRTPAKVDANKLERQASESNASTRQRSGSSDSYLCQPLTGSMQVLTTSKPGQQQPVPPGKSTSHDSVLSAATSISSAALLSAPSPSISSLSLTGVRPDGGGSLLSSGYAFYSPVANCPSPSLPAAVTEHEAVDSTSTKSYRRETRSDFVAGVVRSKTVDIERMIGVGRSHHVTPASKEEWLREKNTSATIEQDDASKKKAKKKYIGSRNQTDYLPAVIARPASATGLSASRLGTGAGNMTAVLRKRWEIISSNPDGPETLV